MRDQYASALHKAISEHETIRTHFEKLRIRAEQLATRPAPHGDSPDPYMGGKYSTDKYPGFKIAYPFGIARFSLEATVGESRPSGTIIVSRETLDADGERNLEPVLRVPFDHLGNLVEASDGRPVKYQGTMDTPGAMYEVVMDGIVAALNGRDLRTAPTGTSSTDARNWK